MTTQKDIKKAAMKTGSKASATKTNIKVECPDADNASDFLALVLDNDPELPYAVPADNVFVFSVKMEEC